MHRNRYNEDLRDVYRNDNRLIMIGKVSAIYPEEAKARVIFEDRDQMVSKKLPLVFTRAFGVEIYAMPKIDEEVVCIFLGNGLEEGFILGGYYNKKHVPPRKDERIKIIRFENGDYIQYKEGVFTIKGDVRIKGRLQVEQDVKGNTFHGLFNGASTGEWSGEGIPPDIRDDHE